MKLLILSSDSEIASTKALVSAARARRLDVEVAHPLKVHFEFSSRKGRQTSTFFVGAKKISRPDLILPRFGWKTLPHGLRIAQAFAATGVAVINSPESLQKSADKLITLIEFHAAGLPHPRTKFTDPCVETAEHLLSQPPSPQVFKLLSGSQGFGVTLAETKAQAQAQADAYRNIPAPFLVQEFIREVRQGDLRAFVIDGKVVAAMKRRPVAGDFRANVSQGARMQKVRLSTEEIRLAEQASQVMGLYYAGVDFIRTPQGPLLIEANGFPGLAGISEITKVPVAKILMSSLQQQFSAV
jgi:ribosomal protein S6--L-glutamate ligase